VLSLLILGGLAIWGVVELNFTLNICTWCLRKLRVLACIVPYDLVLLILVNIKVSITGIVTFIILIYLIKWTHWLFTCILVCGGFHPGWSLDLVWFSFYLVLLPKIHILERWVVRVSGITLIVKVAERRLIFRLILLFFFYLILWHI